MDQETESKQGQTPVSLIFIPTPPSAEFFFALSQNCLWAHQHTRSGVPYMVQSLRKTNINGAC